jgi:hypothetical protein
LVYGEDSKREYRMGEIIGCSRKIGKKMMGVN